MPYKDCMSAHDKLIKAMQDWIIDEPRRLKEKWSKATEVYALHIHYADPAPDGDFEILFVTGAEADKKKKRFETNGDRIDVISFANGMALAQEENCCGGSHSLEEAKAIIAANPALAPDGIDL